MYVTTLLLNNYVLHQEAFVLQAFFQGKLKIKGSTALAMKLKDLKLPEGAATTAPAPATKTSSGPKPGSEFKVASVFDLIKAELDRVGFPNFV